MLRATWTAGSLRLWVFVGMALTALPLLISAVVGYAILSRGVVAEIGFAGSKKAQPIKQAAADHQAIGTHQRGLGVETNEESLPPGTFMNHLGGSNLGNYLARETFEISRRRLLMPLQS